MPIQIKEIVVKATVNPNSETIKQSSTEDLAVTLAKLKEEIIDECLAALSIQQNKEQER